MLWKPDQSHIMKWDSPWGTGYPGWHIECSAMARKKLQRDVIDIHTGGEDLIFPHHECEIAQSCGTTGKELFARYWMHARFLMVEGEKMSKSKGNFFTVRDVLQGKVTGRPVHPAVLRFELTKSHYRANMNFTTKGLVDSANTVRKLNEFHAALVTETGNTPATVDLSHPLLKDFSDALGDDLNIAGALGILLPWINSKPANSHEALAVLNKINHVLNVAPLDNGQNQTLLADANSADPEQQQIQTWCTAMDTARKNKDWTTADLLRKQIQDSGFEVRQSPQGTVIQKKLI
jgi:cysteinyl-tRNA synthetase